MTKGIKSRIQKMYNNFTPNTFAPLRPITPARVAVWPPHPISSDVQSCGEQRYGATSNGSSASVASLIIISIITLALICGLTYFGYNFYTVHYSPKSSPGQTGSTTSAAPITSNSSSQSQSPQTNGTSS